MRARDVMYGWGGWTRTSNLPGNNRMSLPVGPHPNAKMAPVPGLEPGTIRLTGGRSTIELYRNKIMVPEAGLEPACPVGREILSLLCLPIPPFRQKIRALVLLFRPAYSRAPYSLYLHPPFATVGFPVHRSGI